MKKWPGCDVRVQYIKSTDMYKAVAKSKLPCGATQLEVVESSDSGYASSRAKAACVSKGRIHIVKHRCNE